MPGAPGSLVGAPPRGSPVTADRVRAFAADALAPSSGPRRVGVESEWFVVRAAGQPPADPATPDAPTPADDVLAVDCLRRSVPTRLPCGSTVSFEPGGQIELSSAPEPLPDCLRHTAGDLATLRHSLATAGLDLAGLGLDPLRPPVRRLDLPRYAAMSEYFGAGPGRTMMCSTAGLQVNLDTGGNGGGELPARPAERAVSVADRWRLAHQLGPVLVAAFAASPLRRGEVTGWRSTRQWIWAVVDPGRTRPALELADDPVEAWARYIMAARVMLLTDPDGACLAVRDGSTFGDWVAGRGPATRLPTEADLACHATTLFPPVRPRGWLEIRYLDALPAALWQVPVTVLAALLDDPAAADAALDVTAPLASHWVQAARLGPADPDLRRAGLECFRLAAAALPRLGAGGSAVTAVESFAARYLEAARCPADDMLDMAALDGPAGLLAPEALSVAAPHPQAPHTHTRSPDGRPAGGARGPLDSDAQEVIR